MDPAIPLSASFCTYAPVFFHSFPHVERFMHKHCYIVNVRECRSTEWIGYPILPVVFARQLFVASGILLLR